MLLYEAARKHAHKISQATPVDRTGTKSLEQIAAIYGATVFFRPLKDDVSGVVIKNAGEDPTIFINTNETFVRQRFTLAHEIGHLVERRELGEDDDYSFVDGRIDDHYDLHEFFADEFAGSLLMPAEEFLRVYDADGKYATAVHFGVSVPAVEKRKKRLDKNPPVAQ